MNRNAEVIFMICSHLQCDASVKPYEPSEWSKLAQVLLDTGLQPSDLPTLTDAELRDLYLDTVEINRIRQLLGRGGSLSFALEQYENMGISVVTRADALYPKSLKLRLGKNCPPLFYYAGNLQLAGKKAIGFVGARGADDHDQQFTESTVSTVNSLGFAVVSGGAKGVDTMASSAAIRNGSAVISYLADSLVKQVRNRENILAIQNHQLLLLSAVKPDMGFTAGTAMMRNRYIYAQSACTVVVRSDYKKGGTWNGAVDSIKHEICPVLCWDKSEYRGNQELIRMGAVPIDMGWNGDLTALPVKEEDPVQLTLLD